MWWQDFGGFLLKSACPLSINLKSACPLSINQAIKRNTARFPESFAFRLTKEEKTKVVTDCDHLSNLKFSRVEPLAFTEHGALMAANVLNSQQAIEMSVKIVEAFVRLRRLSMGFEQLAQKIEKLERRDAEQDEQLKIIYEALAELMTPPESPKREIGFHSPD